MADTPDPENDDNDVRFKKLERFILAGAIIGPILIGLWSYYRRSDAMGASVALPLTMLRTYAETMVIQGLTIWIALRYSTLGGKTFLSLLIVLTIMSALAFADYVNNAWWFDTSEPAMRLLVLISRPTSLLMGVVAMVLARRVFKIVMIRRNERNDYIPKRLSIGELMIWTLVIAGFFALHHQMNRWLQNAQNANIIDTPGWFAMYSILTAYVPSTLLVVVISQCQQISFWRWFPAVTIVYAIWHIANSKIQLSYYNQLGLVGPGPSITSQILSAVLPTLMTTFVIGVFRKLEYRFVRPNKMGPLLRVADNLPSDGEN